MMTTIEQEYSYWLNHVAVLGAVKIKKLWELSESFEQIYYIEGMEFSKRGILTEREAECFEKSKESLGFYREEYHSLGKRGIQFITPFEERYPERLKHIYGMPMGLYVQGKLPGEERPTAAIIGARNCSNYGGQMAEYLGDGLSQAGIQIISGLAAGIDGAGHRGALRHGAATYGVSGCGINICYPKENYQLYEQMKTTGGIVTEFHLGEQPKPQNFPMRNRIISGLSDVILVIEAREKSGSLITASLGLDQGKDVFALPGRVTDALSSGCHQLIKDGAGIITSLDDIIDYFGINYEKIVRDDENSGKGLAKTEKIVYSCLDLQPKFLEQIVTESRLPLQQCISALLELKLKGYAIEISKQYYIKKL